ARVARQEDLVIPRRQGGERRHLQLVGFRRVIDPRERYVLVEPVAGGVVRQPNGLVLDDCPGVERRTQADADDQRRSVNPALVRGGGGEGDRSVAGLQVQVRPGQFQDVAAGASRVTAVGEEGVEVQVARAADRDVVRAGGQGGRIQAGRAVRGG